MRPATLERHQELGHEVAAETMLQKWLPRGVKPCVLEALQGRVVYTNQGRKNAWRCLHCAWHNLGTGITRPLEHSLFSRVIRVSEWYTLNAADPCDPIPAETEEFIKADKSKGDSPAPCSAPLPNATCIQVAMTGERSAVQWASFSGHAD